MCTCFLLLVYFGRQLVTWHAICGDIAWRAICSDIAWHAICSDIAWRAICSDIDLGRHLASMVKLKTYIRKIIFETQRMLYSATLTI